MPNNSAEHASCSTNLPGDFRYETCGAFCHGERGLRDHQHIKHTGNYEDALQAVAAAKGTVVRYSAVGAHLAGELRTWKLIGTERLASLASRAASAQP